MALKRIPTCGCGCKRTTHANLTGRCRTLGCLCQQFEQKAVLVKLVAESAPLVNREPVDILAESAFARIFSELGIAVYAPTKSKPFWRVSGWRGERGDLEKFSVEGETLTQALGRI